MSLDSVDPTGLLNPKGSASTSGRATLKEVTADLGFGDDQLAMEKLYRFLMAKDFVLRWIEFDYYAPKVKARSGILGLKTVSDLAFRALSQRGASGFLWNEEYEGYMPNSEFSDYEVRFVIKWVISQIRKGGVWEDQQPTLKHCTIGLKVLRVVRYEMSPTRIRSSIIRNVIQQTIKDLDMREYKFGPGEDPIYWNPEKQHPQESDLSRIRARRKPFSYTHAPLGTSSYVLESSKETTEAEMSVLSDHSRADESTPIDTRTPRSQQVPNPKVASHSRFEPSLHQTSQTMLHQYNNTYETSGAVAETNSRKRKHAEDFQLPATKRIQHPEAALSFPSISHGATVGGNRGFSQARNLIPQAVMDYTRAATEDMARTYVSPYGSKSSPTTNSLRSSVQQTFLTSQNSSQAIGYLTSSSNGRQYFERTSEMHRVLPGSRNEDGRTLH